MIFKKINKFKAVNSQTDENKVLKSKVLTMLEIFLMNYRVKYNDEKDGLNIKSTRIFYHKKLRLIDDYQ